ncbi:4-(cytidine 5'-diphospho)-2-C-methyl-D-erythritol kinase [Rhodovibrio salinarum]|uniref:4-diphosphocytidyl-2-C-methyl-D-erythritol kinase n=1 Tax=Rhodovibrio salinarum TaxID=1087 RepID=A0A934QJZ2_9PROT|nr:4-(cytidine 5'-diphospho)-2-C-methyl-D-erythritol kinase [Rhodovibrio salinarum]MBK1698283.1 4-(cytidine 5'-diphospho)-2-C-methyl-D-erythritol kinase [Rhodovibrio salinarum]
MTESAAVQRHARAKVNLSLRVTGKRADGYHELDGLTAFAQAGDLVTVWDSDALSLEIVGPYAGALSQGAGQASGEPATENLVLRAARALATATGRPARARILLDKQLPVAGGLGGGSADAAATLHALCQLWGVDPGPARLAEIGLQLGADVPVCLHGYAAFVSGIGERLGPAPHLPEAHVVLANPGVELSTAAVFKALEGQVSGPVARWDAPPRDAAALADYLARDGNDLEAPARRLRPEIDAVLTALAARPGCLIARMSGSGATCFGLFAEAASAEAAAAQLAADRPDWWLRAARLIG